MRGDADPGPVPLLPVVGVAAAPLLPGDGRIRRRRMDDRDVAEDPDPDVFTRQPLERPRSGRAREELCLVEDFAGRRRALEVVRQQLAETLDVARADRVEI